MTTETHKHKHECLLKNKNNKLKKVLTCIYLLYEDRLLAVDTPETLKECFSLSKSLHENGIFSWYSYTNHVRTKYKMDLGNQDMKKNSCKIYYKNILNKV